MAEDAGEAMKAALRADLRVALKEKRSAEAKVIRALVAALDNAEALPVQAAQSATHQHDFRSGSAEAERLLLSQSQVRDVLLADAREREHAADVLERVGKEEEARALRADAAIARRYLGAG